MPLQISSKYDGKCKVCGKEHKQGATLFGITTPEMKPDKSGYIVRWCSDQTCGPLVESQKTTTQQTTTTTKVEELPTTPNSIEGAVVEYTTQIMQIRGVVTHTVKKYDPDPNPAMIGQIVGLIWEHLKHHNGGVQK